MRMRYDFIGWLRNAWDTLTQGRYEKQLIADVNWHKSENERLKAKLEKMELAIMPLASQAGAAYARSVATAEPVVPTVKKHPSQMNWRELQASHAEEIAKENPSDERSIQPQA